MFLTFHLPFISNFCYIKPKFITVEFMSVEIWGMRVNFIYAWDTTYTAYSKSKRLSEILRDIRTSTYQICRKINRTSTFRKWICNLTPEIRDILKLLWKRGEIAPLFSSFPQRGVLLFSTVFCYLLLDFHIKTGTRSFSHDKRSFEISEVEITRVDCSRNYFYRMYTDK